jgi:serine/threonine protein phosphatase 1
MRRYAVPDLHGRRDLLDAAIAAIAAHGGGEVVFLGDYIDRGPDSRGVVERLLAGPPPRRP